MTELGAFDDERSFIERSLADLDAERAAGDLTDADYAVLKDQYEARLARSGEQVVTASPSAAKRSTGRVVASAAAVAALAAGAGWGAMQFAGARQMGDTITGGVPADRRPQPAASTTDDRLAEAAQLAAGGDVLGALKAYDAVLAEKPDDPAALTYKGWLLRNVGAANDEPRLTEQGVVLLEQATQADPTFSEAWLFLGIVYFRDRADPERAADALRLALANDPIAEVRTSAQELLDEIESAS